MLFNSSSKAVRLVFIRFPLISKLGADINVENDDEETPLMLAECLGEQLIANFLSAVRK